MFQAKPWVLDRIEQSFTIFFKKPLQILLPFLLFHILMFILVPEILKFTLWETLINQSNISHSIILLIYLWVAYGMIYLILVLPITYATIKTICETILGENTKIEKNIWEGFSKLGKVFKVYWFIFAYAYLIPALCFIAWGFIMLGWMLWNNEMMQNTWMILMWLSSIYALIQGIYRWLKTSFALPSAIYNKNYEKNNFHLSVNITDGKWWRILWNYLLVGIIWWLMIGLISGLIESFGALGSNYGDIFSSLSQEKENFNIEESMQVMLKSTLEFSVFAFIASILNTILDTLLGVFALVFSVVFYLRLRDEYSNTHNPDSNSQEKLPVLEEL